MMAGELNTQPVPLWQPIRPIWLTPRPSVDNTPHHWVTASLDPKLRPASKLSGPDARHRNLGLGFRGVTH